MSGGQAMGRAALAAALLLGGCVSGPRGPGRLAPAPFVETPRRAEPASGVELHVQYRPTVIPGAAHTTCEVFLENAGPDPLTVRAVRLDGRDLPAPWAKGAAAALSESGVRWWQCYPSSNVAAGAAAAVQVNFVGRFGGARRLEIETAAGETFARELPPYRGTGPRLAALTYEADGTRAYLKIEGASAPPARLWLDRRPVAFTALAPAEPAGFVVLAAPAPVRLTNGLALHARVEFGDGSRCDALGRVLLGVPLDNYYGTNTAQRAQLGLWPLERLPYRRMRAPHGGDVTCWDVKRGPGAGVGAALADRHKAYEAGEPGLTPVNFCTGMFTELWDLYGALADLFHICPYSFGFGPDPRDFLAHEARMIERGVRAAGPRPAVWIAETVLHRGRAHEPEELDQLLWVALTRGVKGVSYFTDLPGKPDRSLARAPALQAAVAEWNRRLARLEPDLAPMLPVRRETRDGVEITECWAGDRAVVLVFRNLEVTVRPEPGDGPSFRAEPKRRVDHFLRPPAWLGGGELEARDWVTGEPVRHRRDAWGGLAMELDELRNVRAVRLGAKR